ncbi:polyphosphate kinase 2 family protein [Salinarimonas soli]|uniref:Polyphosphate kinase 2 family protein n=1 Tax=Salinarimonas soli TaxID=1638099 RepID=A0A5B2VGI2_9HYPH|nr:polyphosphate kinase 2 family protein [Salinarimonas soli]KAA2237620.1 polyphosphate kinase 2 family protein [Salinarimonas soli]
MAHSSWLDAFLVEPGATIDLEALDPRDRSRFPDEESARAGIEADAKAIDDLQDRLYAEGRRSLLVVLQGTDTSGKDGTIRHVFGATGPLGVHVHPFGPPSREELAHDFLWRIHRACPARGTIGIFNRSHYEDVLVGRVRGLAPPEVIEQRYAQINDFERLLVESGTVVLKFMLNISKAEQGKRLQGRLDDPAKHWKFNEGDLADRALWDEYREAYRIMLERCSTAHAPWRVIPADRKWARNAAIAAIVRATLEAMDPRYPETTLDASSIVIR